MTDKPLPCPFCGVAPRLAYLAGAEMAGCVTKDCVAAHAWTLVAAWNTRAPAAEPAVGEVHPGAEAARGRILRARSLVIDDMRRRGSTSTLTEAANDLTDAFNALDALRPSAAPVSMAFWLGREAS